MMKKLRPVFLVLIMMLLMMSLIGCGKTKTLKEDQYQVYCQGNSFIVKVTDTDINAQNIQSVKVKIKYKYADIEYSNGSSYATDIKNKTKTETVEVSRYDNLAGNFMGGFQTEHTASEFECKKVVAYYGESYKGSVADGERVSVPMALVASVVFFIVGVVAWFVLSLFMDVNVAFYISVIPYVVCFLGVLVTGQWIPALIFFIAMGAFLSMVRFIFWKIVDR